MSLFYASINSGSNGNCYYVGSQHQGILVDAGLNRKETLKRMERMELSPEKLRAIFVSHEHIDHVRGVAGMARRFNLPVYLSKGTYNRMRNDLNGITVRMLKDEEPVVVDDLLIYPFKKLHDAASPFSFVIEHNEQRVGVFTDLGRCCDALKNYYGSCHAAFLEANYDTQMLEHGPYPMRLKDRIRGGKGHLSNLEALDLFLQYSHAGFTHVLLAHLSEQNNDPDLVQQLFEKYANGKTVHVASRYQESEVFCLPENTMPIPPPVAHVAVQMTLF